VAANHPLKKEEAEFIDQSLAGFVIEVMDNLRVRTLIRSSKIFGLWRILSDKTPVGFDYPMLTLEVPKS